MPRVLAWFLFFTLLCGTIIAINSCFNASKEVDRGLGMAGMFLFPWVAYFVIKNVYGKNNEKG